MPEQKNCKRIFLTAAPIFLSVLLYWSQNHSLKHNHTNKLNRQDFLKCHHKVVDKIAAYLYEKFHVLYLGESTDLCFHPHI